MKQFCFYTLIFCHLLFANSAISASLTPTQLKVNEGKFFSLSRTITEVLITDPAVADVQITRDSGILIYGKKTGRTHIIVLASNNRVLFDQQIRVYSDLSELKALLAQKFPKLKIELHWIPGRLMLSGNVQTQLQMETLLDLASGVLRAEQRLVNNLTLASASQVNLKVRIMEMNRTETENLGLNWDVLFNPGSVAINLITGRTPLFAGNSLVPGSALQNGGSGMSVQMSGNQGSVGAVLDALIERQLVTVLAEPNLSSRSGETASFFAGGEFPIPVSADGDQIRIEFKKFGVMLDMTPTVLSKNRIQLHIKPEVSELTSAGAVRLNNIVIPGIAVRRTEATIELLSGQSFAVAGLLQNQRKDLLREVPWLSDLEILGPLFKSKEYQNSETELVVIATANIVRPLDRDTYQSPEPQLEISPNDPQVVENKYSTEGGFSLFGPRGYVFTEN